MREGVGIVDLSAFAIFDIQGAGALDFMQKMAVNQIDVPLGRVTYTNFLNEKGGIKSDLTIMRLGQNYFRVVTGAFDGMRDKKWLTDHLPADGSVTLTDVTSAWATLGVWGPNPTALAVAHRNGFLGHGIPVCHLQMGRVRTGAGACLAYLVRGRARLGVVCPL